VSQASTKSSLSPSTGESVMSRPRKGN
jgi:hypothetical protein